MEALIACMMASGPAANRPPHMAFAAGALGSGGVSVIGKPHGGNMLRLVVMGLYTALLLGANPTLAGVTEAQAALAGDMRKLVFGETPTALPDVPVLDGDDQPHALADWKGKWVVLNFWATWCA